jgi:hypothetical protein
MPECTGLKITHEYVINIRPPRVGPWWLPETQKGKDICFYMSVTVISVSAFVLTLILNGLR